MRCAPLRKPRRWSSQLRVDTGPRIDSYEWAGGREAMLRFGPEDGPVAVLALPLFEEANRTRTFGVSILRALAARGIGGVLPELPGQGESTVATTDVTLLMIREGYAGAIEKMYGESRRAYSICLRSGLAVAAAAHGLGRWCLTPLAGSAVLDDLVRTLAAVRRDDDVRVLRHIYAYEEAHFPMEVAGNILSYTMIEELMGDSSSVRVGSIGIPARTVRIEGDPRPADRIVAGPPLWRRAEPGNDPALAETLAADIADWIAACEG